MYRKGKGFFLITGTSSGIGLALAETLLKSGERVHGISRRDSPLSDRYSHYEHRHFDLQKHERIKEVIEDVLQKIDSSQLDLLCLINNAAIVEPLRTIENCEAESIKRSLDVNLTAPICLTSAFIKATEKVGIRKKVIQISSGSAKYPNPAMSVYSAAKAGLDMFTKCVGAEQAIAAHPVEVISVYPGMVDTPMQQKARSEDKQKFILADYFKQAYEKGDLLSPEEMTNHLIKMIYHTYESGKILDYTEA